MADKLKIKLWCSTNKVGSECEEEIPLIDYGFTDKQWRAMSEDQRHVLLDEWAQEHLNNNGDYGACVE